ncbi:hypothetical protein DFH11DRAFT_1881816 [Phellopilus nigrolimitatus]|nr:hypothetical protein DFH11DRAFT_1881816 [Phellopilus nigrolimitatus]
MICSEQPKLIDLPADVLLRILALCNVVDVMRVETTCKVLRDIVATRHLWLTHLRGLHNRFAPDLAPHVPIESLDGAHLKELVVRAVRGNRNWNSPSPKVTREIKVGVSNPAGEPFMIVDQAALVPGGDYLTIQSSNGYVQLVSVSNGQRLWLYPDPESSPGPPPLRLWHAVDRISEDVLRIAMAETDQSGVEVLTIKIFEISLRQNWSEKIYDYRLVYDKCLVAFSFQGDHIVIEGDTVGLSFLNWKLRCCINLNSQVYGSSLARQLVNGRLFTVHEDEY